MLILGIESTCDETSFSIVRDGFEILSNVVYSQEEVHSAHGGVFPEIASRLHLDACSSVFKECLKQANVKPEDIDYVAVAHGPGLVGSISIGVNFAKGLAIALKKPIIPVNHIEAHLFASFMSNKEIPLPAIGLVISGAHTLLLQITDVGNYSFIGTTVDDAIGEAFDKVGRILGLPYPGGAKIESLAVNGDPNRFTFSLPKIKKSKYSFSFSGFKTAALYHFYGQNVASKTPVLTEENDKKDLAASFQSAVIKHITSITIPAIKELNCKSIVIGGGVSQNNALKLALKNSSSVPVFAPAKNLCADNGAMIAGLAFKKVENQLPFGSNVQITPRLSMF